MSCKSGKKFKKWHGNVATSTIIPDSPTPINSKGNWRRSKAYARAEKAAEASFATHVLWNRQNDDCFMPTLPASLAS